MDPFIITVDGEKLDYRQAETLDLEPIHAFFSPRYTVTRLWQESRHVLGLLEKENHSYFLKLATTKGIGAVTQIESRWNHEYHRLNPRSTSQFWVPQNYEQGHYQDLFFLITDRLMGKPLARLRQPDTLIDNFSDYFSSIIEFSEKIQTLKLPSLDDRDAIDAVDWFFKKTQSWFQAIPDDISQQFQLSELLDLVESHYQLLSSKPRHGDFTPWHLFSLGDGRLGLIDGEHAMSSGVELYDIGYFIQRLHSVLHQPQLSRHLYELLLQRHYNPLQLQVILAARAIGGFLDESLKPHPDYFVHDEFRRWVIDEL